MMDSLTLSQFKGLLETQYATMLSDEYLFREGSNVLKLVEIVKIGYAPDDIDGERGAASSGIVRNGASSSSAPQTHGGLSHAMGCPPGICCNIQ
jgi:hypothetical protein